jgi:hypothetical protein
MTGRTKLAGNGHLQMFAIPFRRCDGISVIQAQVFQMHAGMVDEPQAENKPELMQSHDGMEDSLRNSGGALQKVMKKYARMFPWFQASFCDHE